MNEKIINIIENIKERGASETEIDVAKIMMGVDPFITKGLTVNELRVKAIMGD